MRTTIDLNERLLKKLKKQAQINKTTLSKYVESILMIQVNQERKKAREEFELITVHGELLDQSIDLNRSSELIVQDDAEYFKDK